MAFPPLPRSVIRLDVWYDPAMQAIFDQHPDYALTTIPRDADMHSVATTLGNAHAYQISSAKDENPTRWRADAELLAQAPNLLCVSTSGAGYDTVDVEACTRAGVLVMNQSGANAQSVAEHTIGLMIGVSKRLTETDRRLRRERGFTREAVMGREITGKTLGLVGLGHIGRRVAAIAQAFDMRVIACDPALDEATMAARGAQKVSLETLLAESDHVSLHCPRNADTLELIDAEAFRLMKPGAVFISTARGGIHSEPALIEALHSGHLAGAGVDVWDVEPPPLDHPLLAMPNVIATYHTAGVTHEARRNVATWAAEQIIHTLDGGTPARLVNPDAWPSYAARYEAIFGVRPNASP
ncbi:hydroxyacid dehydrogenase [Aidingimonas halophila]|uniref:D-3-phosphoglycerate dehydrogenase n=1 Tax=Aidingimonas halophila TaxID=574349 RepID=A0A1H2X7A9_9GAMM|nr:hydroxyacid dehydrogenase [Aidingimonas halophila]GHC28233.1 D-3-phosphoglycerate dehydrogenase [Aidingimonas halophila]SDW88691.1 D-3-phosphoglycerate dehydrogenase [Aidingimonas halophila]